MLFSVLFKTFLRPTLEYSSQVCRPIYMTHLGILENCQRRLTKWCPSIRHLPYHERLRHLGLPTVQDRLARGDVILVYQILSGTVNLDWTTLFTRNYSNTRGHSKKLLGFTSKLNLRKGFFTERVINIWNSLPEYVVAAPTLNSFKSRYDAHVSDHTS